VLLVVSDELGGFKGNSLEDIIDERVHDSHGSLADTGVVVDLLEDFVDVDREGLVSGSSVFLLVISLLGNDFLSGGGLGSSSVSFSGSFLGHFKLN